jgi:predicted aspartyl protease
MLRGSVIERDAEFPVSILLDSGADTQYISKEFARKAGLELTTHSNRSEYVQVANGECA